MVLGAACGFLVIEGGAVGLLLLAASLGVVAWKGPRLLALGGLLTSFGSVWAALFARVALTCGPDAVFPDSGCHTEDLTAWVGGSAAIAIAGVLLSAFALRRLHRR